MLDFEDRFETLDEVYLNEIVPIIAKLRGEANVRMKIREQKY